MSVSHLKVTPRQDTHALTSHLFAINMCVYLPTCVCVFPGQDVGQDVETYFQEVLATLEQIAEDGGRGEGGALRSRLQQIYSEIVGDADVGKTRRRDAMDAVLLLKHHVTLFPFESLSCIFIIFRMSISVTSTRVHSVIMSNPSDEAAPSSLQLGAAGRQQTGSCVDVLF